MNAEETVLLLTWVNQHDPRVQLNPSFEPGATIRGAIRLAPAVDEAPADSGTKENR